MTPLTPAIAERYWYMAAGSEFGITFDVREGDGKGVEKEMYRVRDALADPDLSDVKLKLAADARTVTLYKRADAELPA